MTIRPLTIADASLYQTLRLRALQTNPESYLASWETEQNKPTESFAWEIRYATSPPISGYYGIFLEDKLIGYTQLDQVSLPKQQHIAYLYNLYVDPNHRGQGYATKLFDYLSKIAKEQAQVERIFITCNRKNTAAQKLYKKLGFSEYGLKEKSVKWQGEYDDEVEMVKKL
ncbi:MAG: GNAT family N-acetyltransferase [Candidatus Paceibacterota bacterium]